MDSKEKNSHIIKGLLIVGVSIAIMIVVGLVSNAISSALISTNGEGKTKNAQLGDTVLIDSIKTSEVHYIDETLINVPLSVPYEISPSDATNQEIYIVSSDNSVVVVNDDNTVTALKTGEATLTLVANDGSNVTASVKIVIE